MKLEIAAYKSELFGLEGWIFCTVPPPLLMSQDFLIEEGFAQLHVYFSSELAQRGELPETHHRLLDLPRSVWSRGEQILIVIGPTTGDPPVWTGPTLVTNFDDEKTLMAFYENLARHLPIATGFINPKLE